MSALLLMLLTLAPSRAFDAADHQIIEVAGRADYATLPLTVTCAARLASADGYNILIANGDKGSACHWELFTMPGSGLLTAYLPGMNPDLVRGTVSLTDNVWHQVRFVLTTQGARLEVDGKLAGETAVTAKSGAWQPSLAGPLWFGGYPPGGLWCAGQIDDIELTQGERTIGRWRFEDADVERARDESPLGNDGRLRSDETLQPDPANYPFGLGGAPANPAEWGPRCFGKGTGSVAQDWDDQWVLLADQIKRRPQLRPEVIAQVADAQALIASGDRDPLDVALRRTRALLTALRQGTAELDALTTAATKTGADRRALYTQVCRLRRRAALANPLLGDNEILFCARGVYWGHDQAGQHQTTQYFAFNAIPGGGLFAAKVGFERPVVRNLLAGSGLTATAFATPDLDFDGRRLAFAATSNTRHRWQYTPQSTWHLFTLDLASRELRQLTDGAYNDFDPCWLPNGKLACISERRGGYIRCFTQGAGLPVRTYVLHEVEPDGSGIRPLSYFETSEWNPSVNHDGQIVYSRWDYVDREDCLGSLFWQCYPDGRDPRAPHGNYPWPYHTFADNTRPDTRRLRPMTELGIRAVPGSRQYLLTAAPHHGEAYGSLCLLDLSAPDDGAMSQLRRVTPYADFPETETPGRRFDTQKYGTAWPLSEDFYLTNYHENLYLLDRWGNQELLVARADLPVPTDGRWRLTEPIPLRPRTRPPVLPDQRRPGQPATVRVANVYDSDLPLPAGTRIKWLRVVQDVLKDNPWMDLPRIGYGDENTPRVPLGIVPVEDDGSVAFEAPAGRELIYQVLDEHYQAVQSMRSVSYLQPGEELTCAGCHESKQRTPSAPTRPTAFARAPSRLALEPGGGEPVTYHRLVKPVFEQRCVPCHRQQAKGPTDMSYEALRPLAFHFAGGFLGNFTRPEVGGSRTMPGRFGARASRLGRALLDADHRDVVSADDARRIRLWLDCNSPQYGAFHDVAAQERGEVVWPLLDR